MQSKLESLIESSVNTFIGFIVALICQIWVIAPLFNLPTTAVQDTLITIIFTVLSVVRGYLCRRYFNARLMKLITHNHNKNEGNVDVLSIRNPR